MSNADIRGRFIWHELMTTDPDAAGRFYSTVVPWKTQPSGMPSYTLWISGKTRAGGLMALPDGEAPGTPPHWIIYIGTANVDATAEAAQKLGGKVLKGAADIPNVGRFAVLSDPQGAAFAVFTPAPGLEEGASAGGAVGDFSWHELATTDPDSAIHFYSELFGWSKGAAHDMGAIGIYQLISHGGKDVGGIYKARDASVPPSWLSYVQVVDAGKVAAAAKSAGGRVLHGPVEVPGGSWIVMLQDPQGGAFAVVETPKPAKPQAAAVPKKPAAAPPSKPTPATAAPPAAKPAEPKPAAAPKAVPVKAVPVKAAPVKAAPVKAAPVKEAPVKAAPKKAPVKAAKKAAGKVARKAARKVAKKAATKKGAAVKAKAGKKTAKKTAKKAARKAPAKRAAGKKPSKAKGRKKR